MKRTAMNFISSLQSLNRYLIAYQSHIPDKYIHVVDSILFWKLYSKNHEASGSCRSAAYNFDLLCKFRRDWKI